MKLIGYVDKLEDSGDNVNVTLANVRRRSDAEWREFGPGISFKANYRQARKSYAIGTRVKVSITPT